MSCRIVIPVNDFIKCKDAMLNLFSKILSQNVDFTDLETIKNQKVEICALVDPSNYRSLCDLVSTQTNKAGLVELQTRKTNL